MPNDILFTSLEVERWRQFATVNIDFHDRLTVITGANGSGKSTLLNLLSRHLGAERPYLSVPTRGSDGLLRWLVGRFAWFTRPQKYSNSDTQIGALKYSNEIIAPLVVPASPGHQYSIEVPNQQPVCGVSISSHRLMAGYQRLTTLPLEGVPPDLAMSWFLNEANQRYLGAFSGYSLIYYIKQALASWAAFGEGNSILQPDRRQKRAYEGFVEVLKKVLPESLGFTGIAIRPPDIVLVTKTGEFLIDAASGGVTSLIEIAALIYVRSIQPDVADGKFAVVFDEPENHLHPSLQRSLFRSLIDAFPAAQFIAATHSPFIVSSLKDSYVYVLRYQDEGGEQGTQQSRVVSTRLDYANRAGTASEILREVLGLPSTLPEWVEQDLARIVGRYEGENLTKEKLSELKTELQKAGLSELFPQAISNIAQKQ